MQKLVFPIAGRAATMMRSDFCSPEVSSSNSTNPVGMPVMSSFFSESSSIVLNVVLTIELTGSKPTRIASSAISKMDFSASSRTVCVSSGWSNAAWLIRFAAEMRLRNTDLSFTMRE